MPSLDIKMVVRYLLGAIAVFVAGVLVALFVFASEPVPVIGETLTLAAVGDGVAKGIPLTASEALSQGWEDPIRCFKRKGRYFQKETVDGPINYLLQYNEDDVLLAIYFYSLVEMPSPPWQYEEAGLLGVIGGAKTGSMEIEHWSLPIFFRDPLYACGKRMPAASSS